MDQSSLMNDLLVNQNQNRVPQRTLVERENQDNSSLLRDIKDRQPKRKRDESREHDPS